MTDITEKIATGLEKAFAEHGFAEPSVGDLRDAAGVSMRTLYKYAPSREDMVRAALEHRHRRYLRLVFEDLPSDPSLALPAVIDAIARWMESEAAHGCLFHAAVAAAPRDEKLLQLLKDHKAEVAERTARAAGLTGKETDLTLILEGLTQSWPLYGKAAVRSAKELGRKLATAA
ncbi:TetR/AcrR family transcriptional regulator [Labrenzia aggregata]|uniref:TetR/AcrR family transcriptional regulator n=2 Tax=Roseibium aggregatum TaxID=187304 RepID=A0A939EJ22_9HYPH|nr:TetR/AcrR family transcriptional regulator [Roseibium aggregatum]